MSLKITLLVIAAGSVGTLLRYLVVRSFPLSMLPWSTFTVNVTGSFLAGLLFVLMKQRFPAMKAHSAEDSIQKHHHYEARSDTYSPYVRVFPF